jgi:hypothetical protein
MKIEIKNKQIMLEFKKLFENYVILRSVYHFLGGKVEKTLMNSDINLWSYIEDSKLPEIKQEKNHWDTFVMKWFLSSQPQVPQPKEFDRIKRSDVPKLVADEHILSRLNILEKQLMKKIKTVN